MAALSERGGGRKISAVTCQGSDRLLHCNGTDVPIPIKTTAGGHRGTSRKRPGGRRPGIARHAAPGAGAGVSGAFGGLDHLLRHARRPRRYRMEGQDDKLIARANGGSGGNAELVVDQRQPELQEGRPVLRDGQGGLGDGPALPGAPRRVHPRPRLLRLRAGGRFARHREISDGGLDEAGSSIDLLDAFVYGSWTVGERDLNARLGRQVINWGEGLSIRTASARPTQVDINALRRRPAGVKDGLHADLHGLWSYELRDNLTLEGYLAAGQGLGSLEDRPLRHLSTLDPLGEDCATCPPRPCRSRSPAASARRWPSTARPPRRPGPTAWRPAWSTTCCAATSPPPSSACPDRRRRLQYSLALPWYVPELNDTELGFCSVAYNIRVPMISLTSRPTVVLPVVSTLPDGQD